MATFNKKIAIVGLGYVGLPLALLAHSKGYTVFGFDIDAEKIAKLKQKQIPFAGRSLKKQLKNSKVNFTTDQAVLNYVSKIIICVPTPIHENHAPNFGPLISACESVGKNLRKNQLIILESTVNPGVCENIVIPQLAKYSKLKAGKDFYIAHCPERINPGDSKWHVGNIPRVVGSLEARGLKLAVKFYESIVRAPIKAMGSLKEAEAVKIVENSFRDINIAFVNELAVSFNLLGIDVINVIEGAATKPFAFMAHYPGCGVGGHCIPVDPYYLIEYAEKKGFHHEFLALARKINNSMPEFAVSQVVNLMNKKALAVNGSKITVLGLAYKPNIDDTRESPAFGIISKLKEWGADVCVYDPYILAKSSVETLKAALQGAKAVVIATAHREFKILKPKDFKKFDINILVDGRNCFPKTDFIKAGILYKGIGR